MQEHNTPTLFHLYEDDESNIPNTNLDEINNLEECLDHLEKASSTCFICGINNTVSDAIDKAIEQVKFEIRKYKNE